MNRLSLILALLLSASACGDDSSTPLDAGDDAPAADSGDDASATDASTEDATATDAATADAGDRDAGDDAGTADAGDDAAMPDAGDDAGLMDAGMASCGPITNVDSADALAALIPEMYGRSPVRARWGDTGELHATAEITIHRDAFPSPIDCGGCPVFPFSEHRDIESLPEGVYRIPIGTRFRVRYSIGLGFVRGASLVFTPSCEDPCAPTAGRCPVDSACYERGERYCLDCDGGEPEVCACVSEEMMSLPDGTDCFYILGDIAIAGSCADGMCRMR